MVKKVLLFLIIFGFILGCSNSESKDASKEAENTATGDMSEVPLVAVDMSIFDSKVKSTKAENGKLLEESVDLGSTTVNYFKVTDEVGSTFSKEDDGTPLKVVDYGPEGKLPEEMQRPSVHILFSKAMVPLSKLGEPVTELDFIDITPKIDGVFRWYGTNLLTFEADKAILSESEGYSRSYRVSVKDSVKSLSGSTLEEEFSFSFYPKEVELVNLFIPVDGEETLGRTYNVPYELAYNPVVRFNMPVDPDYIRKGMEVKVAGSLVDFTLTRTEDKGNRGDRTLQVNIPKNTRLGNKYVVEIVLKEGALPREGAPEKTKSQSLKFTTLDHFNYDWYTTYNYAAPALPEGNKYPLYIYFTQIVDPNQDFNDIISTSLDIDSIDKYIHVYGNTIHLANLPVDSGDEYTVYVDSSLTDAYGQSLRDGDLKIDVEVPEANSYIEFPDKSWGSSRRTRIGYLESQFDPGLIVQHQNINSLHYNVSRESSVIRATGNTELNPVDLGAAKRNSANFEYIDLNPYMNNQGNGTVFFKGHATLPGYYSDELETREDNLLVQVTDIGITVRYGYNKILVWANSLTDGTPVKGAKVSLFSRGKHLRESKTSDKDGLAIFELAPGEYKTSFYNEDRKSFWVSVESDHDLAELEVFNNQSPWRHGVSGKRTKYAEESLDRIFLFSDRQLYKPGEEVSYRGVHWLQTLGEFDPYKGGYSIKLRSSGYNGDTLFTESGVTTDSGGFFSTFKLPDTIKPGNYILEYRGRDSRGTATIKIANFRRLNFAMRSKIPDRTFYSGDTITIPVSAYYLAGGGMPGADYSYYWTRKITNFKPKGERWKPYIFGISSYTGEKTLDRGDGKLSGSGEASLKQVATGHEKSGGTYRYLLETTVTDIDSQQVSSSASVLVHPSSFYIGAKIGEGSSYWSSFIKANEESSINMALVTPEGDIYKKRAEIVADIYKVEWKSSYQQGVYDRVNVSYRKTEELIDTVKTEAKDGLAKFSYTPESSGSYIARIKSSDKGGKVTETELRFYSYGGGWYYWGGDNDTITLVPDRDLYFVGDKARIMVQSPLKEGKYLLTVEREGIVDESIIELDEDTTMIEVPIEEGYVPRIYVALSTYTNREEVADSFYAPDLGKPKNLFGLTALNVSNATRALEVEVVSENESYRPGEEAEVFIKVTKDGRPVANAELIYLAVDRGVVDLVNYHVPNPLEYFYNPYNFPLYVNGDDLRNYLMDPVTYDISNLQGGDGKKKLNERKDFNPLAAFEPNLITDSKGIAKVTVKLPDTLTTYRTTAIALNGNRLGYSENEILVKNPINIRTAFPRRLRYRDTGTGDIVIQNNSSEEQEVTLTLASETIDFPGESSKTVKVPGNSVYKVPFLMVPKGVGEATVIVNTESPILNEKLTHKMEVERPVVKESFGTTGVVKDKGVEGINIPNRIAEGFGSYDINLYASKFGMVKTPIRALKDTRKLNLTSRIYYYMPDAILGDKMDTLGIGNSEMGVTRVLNELKSNQSREGWIKYWSGQRHQNLYMDIVSLMFINGVKERGGDYNTRVEKELRGAIFKAIQTRDLLDDTTAFGAYILNRSGSNSTAIVNRLLKLEEKLGLTGLGYLTSNLVDLNRKGDAEKVWKEAKKFVRLGTKTIDINEPYETRWYFDSEVRQISALILAGLKLNEPEEVMSRYITTLEDRINRGIWRSRTDYLWSLIALREIAGEDSVENLNMDVTVVLNSMELGTKKITQLSDSTMDINLPLFEEPLNELQRDIIYPLTIEKVGEGNIYYSANIHYGLPSEIAKPRNEGIGLYTAYETLDGDIVLPEDIKVGETYRVRAVISSSKRRSYLTLDIPVPSGMEIVDPSFATTSSYIPDGGTNSENWSRETTYGDEEEFYGEGYGYFDGYYGDFWWYWKNEPDQEIYDNHLTYSWETFYEGKRELTFLVRATSKGIYPTPPAQATLLYEPEVFGRTGGELFVIK